MQKETETCNGHDKRSDYENGRGEKTIIKRREKRKRNGHDRPDSENEKKENNRVMETSRDPIHGDVAEGQTMSPETRLPLPSRLEW